MEIKPKLLAHYTAAYHTPNYADNWGLWKTMAVVPEIYQHDPEKILHNGERDIASVYMPVIGPYDSGDKDLCEYHILLAKAAGIDGFLIDWYGCQLTGLYQDINKNVQTLFQVAELLDFKLALCFEDACCFPPLNSEITSRAEAMQALASNLNYAAEKYFSAPAYLKINQLPVITTKNVGKPDSEWSSPFITATEWKNAQTSLQNPVLLIQNYQPQRMSIDFSEWTSIYPWLSAYFSDYDTDESFWEKAQEAFFNHDQKFISGLVNPGYDDRGVGAYGKREPRVFSRRQGEKYSATWEDNLLHNAQFIQIGTWNDHGEGTGIEPVKEMVLHKNAAVPGWGYRELITTREYAVRFTKKKLWTLPALFLPERLYHLRKSGASASRGDRIRLYMLEGDITGSTLGLEHAGV